MTIRVLVADDQELVRTGLSMILQAQPGIEVIGQAVDGNEAVALARSLRPDVCLFDIRMPGLDGIEATRMLAGHGVHDPMAVVIITTFDLDEYVFAALRAGAKGFLLKDADPELLLGAIRTVHAGSSVIAATATRALFAQLAGLRPAAGAPPAYGALTDREREIFALAARGLSNAEIAAQEFLSEATVKTHVSRILGKLGLRDRVQLVVFAYDHGLA